MAFRAFNTIFPGQRPTTLRRTAEAFPAAAAGDAPFPQTTPAASASPTRYPKRH
ncbi:hypothetical protein DVDV_0953 [Desulfovibrio sp. DV]|nr:hypothetical protein DVDV_0953 [Desulfovibrio sp. DV]